LDGRWRTDGAHVAVAIRVVVRHDGATLEIAGRTKCDKGDAVRRGKAVAATVLDGRRCRADRYATP